jgi:hypothetical protein
VVPAALPAIPANPISLNKLPELPAIIWGAASTGVNGSA